MSNEKVRVRGLSVVRPIIYGNTATVLSPEEKTTLACPPDHTHKWTVAVRSAASAPNSDIVGGADDLSYFLRRVTFKLHETYPNNSRSVEKPPFEVTETGWGEFEIHIRLTFVSESGEKSLAVYHHLKLHPWTATGEPEIPPIETARKMGPVHSWQYDEIVFSDPFANFLTTLTKHPPTPLPKLKNGKKPVPFHLANLKSLEASRTPAGVVPEFNKEMEKEEIERLDDARKQILKEQQRMRKVLLEKEAELEKLKQSMK